MIQDNIKDFAVAAFRLYGHRSEAAEPADEEIIKAVGDTIKHLTINGDADTVNIVCRVYCDLPLGKLRKGEVSARVETVASELYISERNVWRRLALAQRIFGQYYREH